MHNARPQRVVRAFALVLVALAVAFTGRTEARADELATPGGTVISNRAEATYLDEMGTAFGTVSSTVSLTVLSVSSVVVTPDETEPSNTVAPNERITRLFRICNGGNTPDLYTITRAEVSAPATLVELFFDLDASGTVTSGDRPVAVGGAMSPRLTRGTCAGLLAVVETNAAPQGTRLQIGVTARSNVSAGANGMAQDDGTIINIYGNGSHFSSPDDPHLPPVKLVENRERVSAALGQTLTYTVAFRNSGDVPARRAVMRDELPAGLEYVAGSLRLNNRTLTDADDADEGKVAGQQIEVRWSEIAIGELVQIVFHARVRASVQPGTGLVNTAMVSADNAAPIISSSTVAVVNPFGLVYEARGGGGATIGGARVSLLQDRTTGAGLSLTPGAGTAPNERNDNPFLTDGQGRWNFALAANQLGSVASPARYFLNVSAQGFRTRMLEISVAPSVAAGNIAGLFSVVVRSIDGQPIAQNGSFELTEEAVTIENLAAFALNVPMFENQAVEIAKIADRAAVEIGDVVSYRVEVHNATAVALNDVEIRDVLPASFHYAAGTGRLENPPDAARAIEPTETGGAIVFHVGQVRAGARATVTYRVRVGVNAREGEQVNTASASGVLLSGERVNTAQTHATVRVRRGLFSTQQIILGRVFEDANGNGQFDKGESALAGVRLYLNNGQSVVTDSAGQYNFPSVNDGALVIALDPVTLPDGYSLADNGTHDAKSFTRLLRTPLGGGSMLRQNFALKSSGKTSANVNANAQSLFARTPAQEDAATGGARNERTEKQNERPRADKELADARNERAIANTKSGGDVKPVSDAPLASGTYEMAATETLEPVAPGAVRIVSPAPDAVVTNAALEIEARVADGWTVALEVEGARISDSKIGMRRVDRKNQVTTYSFVGVNLRPGPNRIRATALSPDGASGESIELTAYGRGPAKRLEVVAEKKELSAGGRDSTLLRVRAYDQWGHMAADTVVALEATAGRLLPVASADKKENTLPQEAKGVEGIGEGSLNGEQSGSAQMEARQQMVQLTGGEGTLILVADNTTGAAEIRATTGAIEAETQVRITPEVRPSILVGLAEVSIGKAAPEMELRGTDGNWQSRIGFFYRGRIFSQNLLTLAYDSNRALNRNGSRDRLFQLDPLERAYPLFGDSSTRYEDAQSNSKLYARLDRGRSYFLFGDFETEHKGLALAGYTRKLTGIKVHAENSEGDYISLTGARPDTAFARDVLAGGGLSLAQLSHGDIMPGSEVVVIEVRDRRNPERILSREPLIRSVDYNLDTTNGNIFFLRPISAFDYALNLMQVVVTYEHRANQMSSAVYTARAVKTFKKQGLRLGVSIVDQQQADFGAFVLGGIDGEKKLPRGGTLAFEYAMSRGQASFSGNLFGTETGAGVKHNGSAYRVELEQPLPYKEGILRAGFARADEGFLNPFGSTITAGSQRAHVGLDLKVRPSSIIGLEFMDERNSTSNVSNRRFTGSLNWSERWNDRFRTTVGYDFRRLTDDVSGRETNSNLVTVGAEWQATDKLQLAVKREQNLGEADPTYPDQTTLSATYQWNQWARVFLTQRLASAPIVPISDAAATGFVSTGARRETAIGVETKVGRYTSVGGRYQIENGINGTDSFAVIGLQNRLPLGSKLSLELGYERGFHIAGTGESFNNATVGFSYQPTENFRTSGRYEMRDRNGMGSVATLGAAGRLADGITALVRWQAARTEFNGRHNSSTNASAALAWRPLKSDRVGLLFSYTHRNLFQDGVTGTNGTGSTRDRADVLSTDAYLQATKELELYGRFAFKFGDAGTPDLAPVSSLTYLAQGRAVYRLGKYVDVAGEMRMLAQPSSRTRRTSYGAELGFWVLPDLRLGGGYNLTDSKEPQGSILNNGRRGFYFTISSKLSRLFDLFGTSSNNGDDPQATSGGDSKTQVNAAAAKEQP
ncbi:MAG TPA: SdrD B-like domain-containing protein [Pyrinomonadaceae bacterium]|nr:SdrD B-like domain-containing protein [Pyrinomonadaceae bacterium]